MSYTVTEKINMYKGLCRICGGNKDKNASKTLCKECLIKIKNTKKCRKCGAFRDNETQCCTKCREKIKIQLRKSNAKRSKCRENNGFCRKCDSIPYFKSKYCRKHFASHVLFRSNLSLEQLDKIIQKLEQSNFKCFYTGQNITPGVNASVDHLKPCKRFPDYKNDINNFVWCDKKINQHKADKTTEEFYEYCNRTLADKSKDKAIAKAKILAKSVIDWLEKKDK